VNSRNTFAEIDLQALTHNFEVARTKTRNASIVAVVKADAYGHGAIPVSRRLLEKGASMLGVAFVNEAIELREAGIKSPILVFFDPHNTDYLLQYNLIPVLSDYATAKALSEKAHKLNRLIPVHIKIDTGMGRIGIQPEQAIQEIQKIAGLKNLVLEGIMSHFSDADLADRDVSLNQYNRFRQLIEELKERNIHFKYTHIANSAAVMNLPDSHMNMVRPGIMLYGYGEGGKELKPVMTLKSKPILIKTVTPGTHISYGRTFTTKRKSRIATLPVGYADGYSRHLSNKGEVLISGKRAPVVGRVCMDTIMVDITDIPEADETSEFVLIGRQGEGFISAQEIAEKIGTIPYEVLTSIGKRVKRFYR
jgi:alanine racemase